MLRFLCLDALNHVVGIVYAVSGDIAWEMAQALDPRIRQIMFAEAPTLFEA
jgi:hypothetical protein